VIFPYVHILCILIKFTPFITLSYPPYITLLNNFNGFYYSVFIYVYKILRSYSPLLQLLSAFLSLLVPTLKHSLYYTYVIYFLLHKWGRIVIIVFLSLPYFASHNLQFHPFSCKWHNFILLHDKIIFHLSKCHIFFIPSSLDGHLDWFHGLAIVSSTAVNMNVSYYMFT
jgi:hypothetical protein